MPWSVVAPMVPVLVPPVAVKTTVSPPVVMLFPPPSLAWSVNVTALPDCTVPPETVTADFALEYAPLVMSNAVLTAFDGPAALAVRV